MNNNGAEVDQSLIGKQRKTGSGFEFALFVVGS